MRDLEKCDNELLTRKLKRRYAIEEARRQSCEQARRIRFERLAKAPEGKA